MNYDACNELELGYQYELMFSLIQTQVVKYKNTCRWVCVCVCIQIWISINTYISLLCQLTGSRSNDPSVTTSIHSIQILVSNTIFQCDYIVIYGERADFRTGAGNI